MAQRETLLYGKKYKRGVPAKENGVNPSWLNQRADRVDVEKKQVVVIDGEVYVKTTVTYYVKDVGLTVLP